MQQNKKCIECGVTKNIELFYLRKDSKDGHHNYCRVCHSNRNIIAVKKWRKTESGRIYMRMYSSKVRKMDKYKDYLREYSRKYQSSDKGLAQRRIIDNRKRKDPHFKLNSNMGRAIRLALNGNKDNDWFRLVDYSLGELVAHLESNFDEKMNWSNYGSYWHIDHIKPRSSFNYQRPTDIEFRECWSLSNLQPLEAKENIRKSNYFI